MLKRAFPPLRYCNLPNSLSTLAAVLGFLSLVLAMGGSRRLALILYPLTLVIDNFDGMVARKLKLTTEFGKQLDTVVDGFNFCFVPAAMAYSLGFSSWPAVASMALFLIGGIWRLTYYGMIGTQGEGRQSYFQGFTTNLCAAIYYVLLSFFTRILPIDLGPFFYPFFIASSFLMISSLKTRKYGPTAKALYILIPLAMISNILG